LETEIRRTVVWDQLRQIVLQTPPEITRAKWTIGVAPATECMLCKHKALSLKKKNHLKYFSVSFSTSVWPRDCVCSMV
jgi:hypothetical protein